MSCAWLSEGGFPGGLTLRQKCIQVSRMSSSIWIWHVNLTFTSIPMLHSKAEIVMNEAEEC